MQDNRESARELFNAIRSVAADAVGEDNLNALKSGIKSASSAIKQGINTTNMKIHSSEDGASAGFAPAICTQCGATLRVNPSQEAAICEYCGTPFVVDNAIKQYNVQNARIQAGKVEVHKKGAVEAALDYAKERQSVRDEKRRERERVQKEEEKKRRERLKKTWPIWALVIVFFISLPFIMMMRAENRERQEEASLQQLVEQIQADMVSGNYDEALVKANQIRFTSSYGETRRKWNSVRDTLITQIKDSIKAEEAAKKAAEEAARKAEEQARKQGAAAQIQLEQDEGNYTQQQQNTSAKTVSYSTNDRETAKNGNSGMFSYKTRGGTYDNYIVVDFDGGFVYYFTDGNGDETCMRVKIDSGTLNDTVIVTFHDGDTQWSEGMHFCWARQPDHLVLEDHNHFTYDYYSTDIQKAFQIFQAKTIHDYYKIGSSRNFMMLK